MNAQPARGLPTSSLLACAALALGLLCLPARAAPPATPATVDDDNLATPASAAASTAASAKPPPATAKVVSVYDGDTLTLENGDRVRLRWANAPELKPAEEYGVEAREATRDLCMGQVAKLSYGPTPRDGYDRLLAGVECQGTDLTTHLLELGLGHVFLIPPDDRDPAPLFAAQAKARAARRGIWSTDRYQGELHITSFHANAPGDDRENVNGEYLRVVNLSDQPVDLSGYRLTDISGQSFALPAVLLPAGNTVKIESGLGQDQVMADSQIVVHLGSQGPIWNNKRDQATIYDRQGKVVDSRLHEVASTPSN